ncbi:MAG TPA: hypothetical protein VF198_05875 [Vicinamibacterales bacterium]
MTEDVRPLAEARPFIIVAALGAIAVSIVVALLFRDPGMPAHVNQDYMRVAGKVLRAELPLADAQALTAALRDRFSQPVTVPALADLQYELEGGAISELGGRPAAVAIFHSDRRDLLVWHAYEGQVSELPSTPDVRDQDGRRYYVHRKTTNTLVFWQDGPVVACITSSLPSEQVFEIALKAAAQ